MDTDSTSSLKTPKVIIFISIVVGIIAVSTLVIYLVKFGGGDFGNKEAFGQFGDFVGGSLNPLLTFLTVVLLMWSIRIQTRELSKSSQAIQETMRIHERQMELNQREADRREGQDAAILQMHQSQMELNQREADRREGQDAAILQTHQNQTIFHQKESIRKQLNDDAVLHRSTLEKLLNKPFLEIGNPPHHSNKISIIDLYSEEKHCHNKIAQSALLDFNSHMEGNMIAKAHISRIKTGVIATTNATCYLMTALTAGSIRTSWENNVRNYIRTCGVYKVITKEQENEFLGYLTTAQEMENDHQDHAFFGLQK